MIVAPAERIARYRDAGIWPAQRFDRLVADIVARVPEREAVIDPPDRVEVVGGAPRRISWAQLDAAVSTLEDNLGRCGLGKDDVALVQMANTWELLAVYLACIRRGIVVSPVPPVYREHELGQIVERTSAKAFFTHARIGRADHAALGRAMCAAHRTLSHLLVLAGNSPSGDGVLDLGAMLAAPMSFPGCSPVPRAPVSADDVATILWTSGSEGRPKGVPRSQSQWLAVLDTISRACRMSDGTRMLVGRPLVTHGAMTGTILPWLHRAGTIVLHHPFAIDTFARQLREERIGYTSIAPAILVSMLSRPELLDGVDFSRLHTIGSGSAPLSPSVITEFERRFGARIVNFFGSTEGIGLAATPHDIPDPQARATLFPRLGAGGIEWDYPQPPQSESRLVDPATGEEIREAGRPGELRCRGPVVFDAYFDDQRLTEAAFDADGWYRSGDLFEIAGDRLQYYRYVGRIKDIIVRGGFNVSAAEVENLVAAYPQVREVGVIGMPDERLGERICAIVAMRPDAPAPTLEVLTDFLRSTLQVAAIKLPERLIVVDALPRNANTKVDKARLRAMLSDTLATPIQHASPTR